MLLRTTTLLACLVSYFSSYADGWRVAYDGLGSAHERGPASLDLAPKASSRPDETHAALMLATDTEKYPLQDFTLSLRYRVKQQLRSPASTINAWETLWVFFNYKADGIHKKTNYLILKENGIEIGKAWGEVDQAFVYTAAEPRLKNLNEWHQLTFRKKNDLLQVQVDRQPASEIKINPKLPLFSEPGAIGLYTEDAHVLIEDVKIEKH